jgi:hypothetical protein
MEKASSSEASEEYAIGGATPKSILRNTSASRYGHTSGEDEGLKWSGDNKAMDSSKWSMQTTSILTPIKGPTLTNLNRSSIRTFLDENMAYEDTIDERESFGESIRGVPMRNRIKPKLLRAIQELESVGESDEALTAFLQKLLRPDEDDAYRDANPRRVLQKVEMDLSEKDADIRVLLFMADVKDAIKTSRAEGLFDSDNAKKLLNIAIMEKIRPTSLRRLVWRKVEKMKSPSLDELYKIALKFAKMQELIHNADQDVYRSDPRPTSNEFRSTGNDFRSTSNGFKSTNSFMSRNKFAASGGTWNRNSAGGASMAPRKDDSGGLKSANHPLQQGRRETEVTCFKCGVKGHVASQCGEVRQGGPETRYIQKARLNGAMAGAARARANFICEQEDLLDEIEELEQMKITEEEFDDDDNDHERDDNDDRVERDENEQEFNDSEALEMISEVEDAIGQGEVTAGLELNGKNQNIKLQLDSGASSDFIGVGLARSFGWKESELRKGKKQKVFLADQRKVVILGACQPIITIEDKKIELKDVKVLDCELEKLLIGRPSLKKLGIDVGTLFLKAVRELPEPLPPPINLEVKNEELYEVVDDNMESDFKTITFQDDVREFRERGIDALFPVYREASSEDQKIIEEFMTGLDKMLHGYTEGAMKVEPMKVRLKSKDAVKQYPLRLSEPQRIWLTEWLRIQVKKGLLKLNPHSPYASPVILIPKKGIEKYRVVIDLRAVNEITVESVWYLPTAQEVFERLRGAKFLCALDLTNGYGQMEVDPSCQEIFSFTCPLGTYTPTRVPQGSRASVAAFSAAISEIIPDPFISYIDDVVGGKATIREQIESLGNLFRILIDHNIHVKWSKTTLGAKKVQVLGRNVTVGNQGLEITPKDEFTMAMENLAPPTTTHSLHQLFHSCNFYRNFSISFAQNFRTLMDKLRQYQVDSRKKKLRNIAITLNDQELDAFQQIKKDMLSGMFEVPDESATQEWNILTDSSDKFWAAVITCTQEDKNKEIWEKHHHLTCIYTGEFQGSKWGWSTYEKELFPIIYILRKEATVLLGVVVHVFTDHRNLKFLMNKEKEDRGPTIGSKLERWRLIMNRFRLEINHIPGALNGFLDYLSRNFKKHNNEEEKSNKGRVEKVEEDAMDEARVSETEQKKMIDEESEGKVSENKVEKVVDEDKKMKLMEIAHSGHRGMLTTMENLKDYDWEKKSDDVKQYVANCLVCKLTGRAKKVLYTGNGPKASEIGEVLELDALDLPQGQILAIKDLKTRFCTLISCEHVNSELVVNELLKWGYTFRFPDLVITDNASYF